MTLPPGLLKNGSRGGPFEGRVYASWPDGSDMAEVARFDLRYRQAGGYYQWGRWDSAGSAAWRQPMLADIEFTAGSDMVLGLRDRIGDAYFGLVPHGDILLGRLGSEGWEVVTQPESYDDLITYDESAIGALAASPAGDQLVATVLAPERYHSVGVAWFDNATGRSRRRETIADYSIVYAAGLPAARKFPGNLGDLELLCPPPAAARRTPSWPRRARSTPPARACSRSAWANPTRCCASCWPRRRRTRRTTPSRRTARTWPRSTGASRGG